MARVPPELWLLLAACHGPTDPTSPTCDADWEEVAEPFFRSWCTSCHAAALEGDLRYGAPADVNLDTLAGVRASADRVRRRIEDGTMPPAGGPGESERADVVAWLDCGAPGTEVPAPAGCEDPEVVRAPVDATTPCVDRGWVVEGDLELSDVALPCLCELHGDLIAAGGQVDLPALERLTGELTASVGLVGLSAPRLVEIGRNNVLTGLTDLAEVDLAALRTVGGDLTWSGLPSLSEVRLPRLEAVGGSLVLEDLPGVAAIDGEGYAVRSIGGDLVLRGLPALGGFYGFGQLETVGGDLVLSGLGGTRLDGFTVLRTVGGDLRVEDHPSLAALDGFDLLESVGGEVVVADDPALRTDDAFARLAVVGGFRLEQLPSGSGLHLPPLIACGGDVVLRRVGVASWSRPDGLETVGGSLRVTDCPELTALPGWDGLTRIEGDLVVTGNPRLPAADAAAIAASVSVGGAVDVSGNGP